MKAKSPTRLSKIETTLKDAAIEFGVVDPPMHFPTKGSTDEKKRSESIPPDKPKEVGKTTQKAQMK
jgi:hypothetical protein